MLEAVISFFMPRLDWGVRCKGQLQVDKEDLPTQSSSPEKRPTRESDHQTGPLLLTLDLYMQIRTSPTPSSPNY